MLLFWLALRSQNQEQMIDAFKHARYGYVLIGVLCMMLSDISRAVRWSMLIRPMGYHVSTRNSFIAVMIGYLSNLAVPRLGEFTRCVVLKRTDDVPMEKLAGTVFMERALDFVVLVGIVGLSLLLEFNDLSNFLLNTVDPELDRLFRPYADINPLIPVGILLIIMAALVFWIYRKYGRLDISDRFHQLMRGFMDGLNTIRKLEHPGLFWAHTAFIWVMYWAMTYVVFFAIDATSHLDVLAGLAVFAIGSIGFIMPVPGGIGTYHWAVTEGLKIYGVKASYGFTYATLVHGSQFVAILIIGGICTLAFMFLKKRKQQPSESRLDEQAESETN